MIKVVNNLGFLKKLFFTLTVVTVFLYMGYVFCSQQSIIDKLNKDIASCERKIQEQNLESENLTRTIVSMSDDEYIEKVARERLGYVMPTEIIFMDASI